MAHYIPQVLNTLGLECTRDVNMSRLHRDLRGLKILGILEYAKVLIYQESKYVIVTKGYE